MSWVDIVSQNAYVKHVDGISCVEDEVEGESQRLVPVLIACDDEVVCSHLQGVFFLAGTVREHINFGTECLCPQYCKVAETTPEPSISAEPNQLGKVFCTYKPTMAIFLPGPAPNLTRGL